MGSRLSAPGPQERRFAAYIEGLAIAAGHEDRQAPLKNYCKGLLLPGERKSIEPMAARLDPENIQPMRQSLHHLVAKAPWSDEVLLEQVRTRPFRGRSTGRARTARAQINRRQLAFPLIRDPRRLLFWALPDFIY